LESIEVSLARLLNIPFWLLKPAQKTCCHSERSEETLESKQYQTTNQHKLLSLNTLR